MYTKKKFTILYKLRCSGDISFFLKGPVPVMKKAKQEKNAQLLHCFA